MKESAGNRFRKLVESESPLQIVGAVNAICAKLAEKTGFKALYLSGAGVANCSFALPDLGVTTLNDVCEDAERILQASNLPLLVDIDTGFGSALNIRKTIQKLSKLGVAAVHIEDQVSMKRCGHRPGKKLVSADEMCDRVKAACDSREDQSLVIMARTDAAATEGLSKAIERAQLYIDAGADMIFAEALHTLDEFKEFSQNLAVPVLANMTEFGQTPYFSKTDFSEAGIKMILYPLSAFRAMNAAAENVYLNILKDGSQKQSLPNMQTRDELYELLNYHHFETIIDKLNGKEN